ncbi:MAG: mechanosensitive ion channel family protein [Gammaproteobacteria bacterium]|jgi:MscS family membrane protein|nr:mechanosensitive ion channel family protein [Gammaproteobacteria bacterium]MBT7369276.1 mechanosensitive ion channel family protein [Gammaproteobacteria bacterium]
MEETLSELERLLARPDVIWVFLVVVITLFANYLARRLLLQLEKQTSRTDTVWDDALVRSARKPLAWLIWALGVAWAAEIVAAGTESVLSAMIDPTRFVAVVGLLAYFLYRFVSEAEHVFIRNGADITTANAVAKLLRVSVIITATLMVLQTLGVSISGVLAFGGIGGIAVGFAAKDLLANFFGGLMVYLDRPFAVGDWIRSPDRNIEGTVEQIGWRLTIIRTFDQRPLYVPNSVFATISLENPSRMHNRRIFETIGLRYDDAAKVQDIVDEVRTMLSEHPDIDTGRTLIVNFNAFGPSSLDFFVYTFTKTTNWVEYHGIKERVLLQIFNIIDGHGAEIAFPTQTLHMAEPEQP